MKIQTWMQYYIMHKGIIFLCPPNLQGGVDTDFGAVLVGVGVSMTLSCLHNILWTSGWIGNKVLWIYIFGT